MSWVPLQNAQNTSGSGTSASVTFSAPVADGSLVLVYIFGLNTSTDTITNITDDQSNSYTKIDTAINPTGSPSAFLLQIARSTAQVTNGPTTITVTSSASLDALWVGVAEFFPGGGTTSITTQAHNANSGSDAAPSSGSFTPSSGGCLMFGAAVANNALSAGTGFTILDGLGTSFAAEYLVQSASAPITTTFVEQSAGSWGCAGCALFAVGANPPPPTDPDWWATFQYDGVLPTVAIDFEAGLAHPGSIPSLIGGSPTIGANGMVLNSTSITGIGAFLTSLQGGEYSIQCGVAGGTAGNMAGIVSSGAVDTDAPLFQVSTNVLRSFVNTGSFILDQTVTMDWTQRNLLFLSSSIANTARISGQVGTLTTGLATVSDAHPFAANPSAINFGTYNGAQLFNGTMTNIATLKGLWNVQACRPRAFTGVNGLWIPPGGTDQVDFGNILEFEYTQPWTVISAVYIAFTSTSFAGMIFTTVPNTAAFPGYELWMGSGKLITRLIHDISNNQLIEVDSTANLPVGDWIIVAETYDGSGLASGVKFYVNGIPIAMTTVSDTLGGLSILGGTHFYIGNQFEQTFGWPGAIGFFDMFNEVKSLDFISSYAINSILPAAALDPSCVMSCRFQEGAPSTTTLDASPNAFTGTLTTADLWLRAGSAQIPQPSGGRIQFGGQGINAGQQVGSQPG